MTIIKEKYSSKRNYNHLIINDIPFIKSYASLLLLNNYLKSLDEDYKYQENWHYLFIVKRHWLRKKRKEHNGHWVCHYCNEKIYKMAKKNIQNHNISDCITVDHKIPKCKCNDITDTSNFLECCSKCNNEKGDKDYNTFLNIKKMKNKFKHKQLVISEKRHRYLFVFD